MKIMFVYIILLFLVACNNSRSNSLKEIEDKGLIMLEHDYCSETKIMHKSDSISFIPLETNENSLISTITKVLYKNGVYYIFDKVQAMIFLFDANGLYISKIHNIGNGPGEYPDISDFDLDANLNIYISSIAGKKIVKYEYPNYKSFIEYKTNASVMEIAVEEESGKIWVSNAFLNENGICLGFYSNEKIIPVIASRGVSDNANTRFKAQSFYKSGNSLFFNPRYSPYLYSIKKDEVCKYMKIISKNFINDSDIESENDFKKNGGVKVQDPAVECLVMGFKSFYQCKGCFLAEIWKDSGFPQLLEYDIEKRSGYVFCPLFDEKIKVYTKIAAVSSSFYISYIEASSYINNYKTLVVDKLGLHEDDNPVLMNIYLK